MKNQNLIYQTSIIGMLLIALMSHYLNAQQKEYDKVKSLYLAKFFIVNHLGDDPDGAFFIVDPLAAAKSTELTSIYYESLKEDKKESGLVLGFFDDFWSEESGVGYKGYSFKLLKAQDAFKFLNKIDVLINDPLIYLGEVDTNNFYFTFQDITVVIYRKNQLSGRIRLFWNGFDAEWENTAFKRTMRRFEKSFH